MMGAIWYPAFAAALFLSLVFSSTKARRTLFEVEHVCDNQSYLTPLDAPWWICCDSEKLKPGISYTKFWKKCATPDDSEKYINTTMWRVYNCIVQNHMEIEGKTLTMENFAHIMTKYYPTMKREAIFDNIRKYSDLKHLTMKGIPLLKTIWKRHYWIELGTCTAIDPEWIEKLKHETEFHPALVMRGGYCNNSPIPIHPSYYPRADFEQLNKTWTMTLNMVGELNEDSDPGQIFRMCQMNFNWITRGEAKMDELFHRPNFKTLLDRITPPWANEENVAILQLQAIKRYLIPGMEENDTFEAFMKEIEERAIMQAEDYFEKRFKNDFSMIRDEAKAKRMMTSCIVSSAIYNSMKDTIRTMLCEESFLAA